MSIIHFWMPSWSYPVRGSGDVLRLQLEYEERTSDHVPYGEWTSQIAARFSSNPNGIGLSLAQAPTPDFGSAAAGLETTRISATNAGTSTYMQSATAFPFWRWYQYGTSAGSESLRIVFATPLRVRKAIVTYAAPQIDPAFLAVGDDLLKKHPEVVVVY